MVIWIKVNPTRLLTVIHFYSPSMPTNDFGNII